MKSFYNKEQRYFEIYSHHICIAKILNKHNESYNHHQQSVWHNSSVIFKIKAVCKSRNSEKKKHVLVCVVFFSPERFGVMGSSLENSESVWNRFGITGKSNSQLTITMLYSLVSCETLSYDMLALKVLYPLGSDPQKTSLAYSKVYFNSS